MTGLGGLVAADINGTLIWTGAGVSCNSPTNLPLGEPLTVEALESFCLPGTWDRIATLHREFGFVKPDGQAIPPRLEVVLGVAVDVAPDAVFALLGRVMDAPPNALHLLCASVAEAGGFVVTANFDECVERAIDPSGLRQRDPHVMHFHGALRRREDLEELGAYFSRIERGFPRETVGRLDDILRASRQIVVLGYSASDYFDVRPYLAGLVDRSVNLEGCTVVWVAHCGQRPEEIEDYQAFFEDAGAAFHLVDGDTTDLGRELEGILGLVPDSAAEPAESPRPSGQVAEVQADPTDRERAKVTFRLYDAMGDVDGRELVAAMGLLDLSADERSAIAWSHGRYTDSLRWARRSPGESSGDRMRRAERTGACLWAQGRLVPALVVLLLNWKLARACLESDDEGAIVAALSWVDTIVRTLEHMDRVELRVLPKRSIRQRIRAMIPDTAGLPFHIAVRVDEVRSFLDSGVGSVEGTAVTKEVRAGMAQAASLSGYVNYRHRELRDRASAGECVPPGDYREVKRLADLLGAHGDAARILFIPGAAATFTMADAIMTLFPRLGGRRGAQFGYWQRCRALGRFALARITHRE